MSTRKNITATADELFYHNGFDVTSFADIAKQVGISRGNFYHHFKTKDDILEAVIDLRLAKTRDMLRLWAEGAETPLDRISCFIHILIRNRREIAKYGCPVGTLVSELGKLDHVSKSHAATLFTLFVDWLVIQFSDLGCEPQDARHHARHLLALSQGVSSVAQALQDDVFVDDEVNMMLDYVAEIARTNSLKRKS
ncbi:TetR/AcrR family transcriptional regulator [Epibacterium ulvae]|uniref:TetR/AcrR family transcriptional regulator n=1 Tax=Epibacterium ulvae TaxID=1156985 RepID=UPI0024921C9E|nr:TetR/AcrR family transcriptional regulator [Epibacterium ulvae]